MARPTLRTVLLSSAVVLLLARGARADDPKPDPKAAEHEKQVQALLEHLKSGEKSVRKEAAEKAKDEQDPKVTAALIAAITDADAQVRRAVMLALAARTEEAAKKDAASALLTRLERLVQYADLQDETVAALGALHDLAQPSTVRVLAGGIDLDRREPALLEARLRAIANVPTAEAIEALIDLMSKSGKATGDWWKKLVREALVYATGEKLAADAEPWRKWWKEHSKDFDFPAAAARRAKERAAKKKKQPR